MFDAMVEVGKTILNWIGMAIGAVFVAVLAYNFAVNTIDKAGSLILGAAFLASLYGLFALYVKRL